MIYRKKSPDVATIEDMQEELKKWKDLANKEMAVRREKVWMATKRLFTLVLVAISICGSVGGLIALLNHYSSEYHKSNLACLPGVIAADDHYPNRKLWRLWDNLVICSDGTKRWVVER